MNEGNVVTYSDGYTVVDMFYARSVCFGNVLLFVRCEQLL